MDPTMTYFKMCDHPIIQEKRLYGLGDFVARMLDDRNKIIVVLGANNQSYIQNYKNTEAPFIWLPRQDQIQAMVDGSWVIVFESFDEWYFNKSYPQETYPNDVFMSMEQMWLAFYMYEKHELIWNQKREKWERTKK